jgi:N-acetyl-anhydromuramyl-L-alanine amidase AmpD
MAQSPEYPDLRWVEPRSWTNANRTSVQLIVIHTTEGSSDSQSAEDGAAYDARRIDGTSAHYFVDNTSTVQCVRTADQAHTARGEGNRRGIHYELCGRARYSEEWWADDYAEAMLRRAAAQAARDSRKWDIPVRHLTVAQVKAGARGFCSHHDISRAFQQSDHTDPGPSFPWTRFLNMVRAELNPPQEVPVTQPQADETAKVTATTGKELFEPDLPAGTEVSEDTLLQLAGIWAKRAALTGDETLAQAQSNGATLTEIKTLLTEIRDLLAPAEEPADPDQS